MIWRCPACRGELVAAESVVRCASCGASYRTVSGIPDLRVNAPAWIDCDEDREQARHIAEEMADRDLEEVVRHVFRVVRKRETENVEYRTRRVIEEPHRLRREIVGWLDGATRARPFLDLGCGPGMLLAAASAEGRVGIGVDVSMVWLVVAKRMVEAFGGTAVLAAGFAEALPLADGSVGAVVSLDVIEHVGDQAAYLREIDRVTAPGGAIALATPNRFSLGPEPHVRVWGVGWLPRPLQQRYAEWRSGMDYSYVRLLSTREARAMLRRDTAFECELLVPPIPDEEIRTAAPARAALARIYNRVVRLPFTRPATLAVGAFFRVVGRKPPHAGERPAARVRGAA
jgi:SAM-dependent methyltransferase